MNILLIIVVAAFFYACLIQLPLNTIKLIGRLAEGNRLPDELDIQDIERAIRMAVWIREREEIKIQDIDSEKGSGAIWITCRKVTYQILVEQDGSGIRHLTVHLKFRKRLDAIKQIPYVLEADRIRYYILEHTDPVFAKGPQTFYAAIQKMFCFRYIVFGIVGWVLSYAIIMGVLEVVTGKDSFESLYTVSAVIFSGLFIWLGHALPNYIEKTFREKLLNGISVPKYLDNDALMELIQSRLRIKTVKSVYFDETGAVSIKGKCGTYIAVISPEMPKLFVTTRQNGDAKECLEADYIRCSIMKLFDSAHPANPEEMRCLLTVVRGGIVIAFLSLLASIFLVVSTFFPNHFQSNGIANSYLTKYSETVTIGEAFDNFFSDPKWESYEIGSKEYVDFTGGCIYLNEPATMTITFRYYGDTFKVDNIAVNGDDIFEFLWPGILEVIYSD